MSSRGWVRTGTNFSPSLGLQRDTFRKVDAKPFCLRGDAAMPIDKRDVEIHGNATGNVVVTGDHNVVTVRMAVSGKPCAFINYSRTDVPSNLEASLLARLDEAFDI